MIARLNKELLKTANCVTVGTITTLLAGDIKQRFPNIDIPEGNIVFWRSRIKHLEKHKYDFMSDMLFEKCFEDIPLILQHPDFLCIKKDGSSISFVKKYSQDVCVVVRLDSKNKYSVRTMYPLMTAQLDRYIADGTAWATKR